NNPRRKRVDAVSFSVRPVEILDVAGLVGAVRTELIHAIFCCYPGASQAELQRYARFGRIDAAAEHDAIRVEMQRLSVRAAHPMLSIASLSGGNQQKAVLTRMLLTEPRVLILDEPTRGVDVGAKYEIYKLIGELARRGMAIVMVSS
ncbi:ATP-binding cassette domain-containing protein, partial [Burkholderia anthina]|uniref:ATP-binding cassette domain-containing protein n=1 Tax=Burkholderia anthina TaxID=179879 RepID=UPI00158AE90B